MVPTKASAGDALQSGWAHLAYVLLVASLLLAMPVNFYEHGDQRLFVVLGVIGAWRYSWGYLHFVRSVIYRRWVFPRMRAAADAAARENPEPHAYLLVTSFRIDGNTTSRVYSAAIRAALKAPGGATVVASIVEMGDQRLIRMIFDQIVPPDSDVKLMFVRINGSGKRDALAFGFRAIAKTMPGPNDVVAVIDGDSIVPDDLVARCAPFFLVDPMVGALTTDETCIVEGAKIFQEWYSLRFAQRQVLMCSMGLSERVLTLTGRMSMFRAAIVCTPEFIAHVEVDTIQHWRLGEIKFLTGDDKSSWYSLLKAGYKMLYVPDVDVKTIEQPPDPSFIRSASVLMTRWFGNMLRTNGRAIALGPQRIGLFTWWAVLDQRMSMWTTLTGLVYALLGAIFLSPAIAGFYVVWVLVSRYVMCLFLLSVRERISIAYPFLLYFNQIYGSLMKTYIFFRLDKQKWTRQNTVAPSSTVGWKKRAMAASSVYMHALSFSVLILFIAWTMGIIEIGSSV